MKIFFVVLQLSLLSSRMLASEWNVRSPENVRISWVQRVGGESLKYTGIIAKNKTNQLSALLLSEQGAVIFAQNPKGQVLLNSVLNENFILYSGVYFDWRCMVENGKMTFGPFLNKGEQNTLSIHLEGFMSNLKEVKKKNIGDSNVRYSGESKTGKNVEYLTDKEMRPKVFCVKDRDQSVLIEVVWFKSDSLFAEIEEIVESSVAQSVVGVVTDYFREATKARFAQAAIEDFSLWEQTKDGIPEIGLHSLEKLSEKSMERKLYFKKFGEFRKALELKRQGKEVSP